MKLDPNCIRDILLTVEEWSNGINAITIHRDNYKDYDLLEKYDYLVLNYHLTACKDDGLFKDDMSGFDPVHIFFDLSPKGREILDGMRSDTRFEKFKKTVKEVGIASIPAFLEIAKSLLLQELNLH